MVSHTSPGESRNGFWIWLSKKPRLPGSVGIQQTLMFLFKVPEVVVIIKMRFPNHTEILTPAPADKTQTQFGPNISMVFFSEEPPAILDRAIPAFYTAAGIAS